MGLLDWIGPTGLTKRRGWDQLPTADQKSSPPFIGSANISPGGTFIPLDDRGTVLNVNRFVQVTPAWTDADAAANSAAFACLQAIGTAIAEPELTAYRLVDGERVVVPNDDAGALLAAPNPHMALDTLLWYLAVCLKVDGNAYWRKLRAGNPETGNVVELWPISPSRMEPITRPGSTDFVSYYRYTPGTGRAEEIAPSNVVHFRYGLDDADHRLGCAPLKRLYREISSDQQATRYADRLLANLAINGLTLSFDKESPPIDQATADELKARITAAYGGDNVGGAAVLSPGASLTALGFSPEQMDMKTLHRVPEERIAAVLGVPAIVAGLGAGLERSTYANYREAREAFTEQTLIPLWRAISATITTSLVPDFTSDRSVVIDFDTTKVRALAEDQDALAARLQGLVGSGILTTDEARAALGYDALPEQPAPAVLPTPEERSRRRAFPVAVERKSADDLPDRLDAHHEHELPLWEAALAAYLTALRARVVRRLRSGADHAGDLVPDTETALLTELLAPLSERSLRRVAALVMDALGVSFELTDRDLRAFAATVSTFLDDITATTRSAIAHALASGHADGEDVEQLAVRLDGLAAFSEARAATIGATELARTSVAASVASYRASGVVVGIRVTDGRDFDPACAAMDGRVFPLNALPPALEHPNCRRHFVAILDPSELEASA